MLQNDVIKCCKMMSPHSNKPATWEIVFHVVIFCFCSCFPVHELVCSFSPLWSSLICLMSSLIGSSISLIPAKICLFSSSWSGFSSLSSLSVGFTLPEGISLFILFFGGDFGGLGLSLSLVHLLPFVYLGCVFNCSLMLNCLVTV